MRTAEDRARDAIARVQAYYAGAPIQQKPRAALAPAPKLPLPCIHRGEETGAKVGCQTCGGNVQIKLYACAGGHGTATLAKRLSGHGCCDGACVERQETITPS